MHPTIPLQCISFPFGIIGYEKIILNTFWLISLILIPSTKVFQKLYNRKSLFTQIKFLIFTNFKRNVYNRKSLFTQIKFLIFTNFKRNVYNQKSLFTQINISIISKL